LGREATFGGCIDNEDDFAFVFGERDGLAFLVKRLEVIKARRRSHGSFLFLRYLILLDGRTWSPEVEKGSRFGDSVSNALVWVFECSLK